GAFGAAVEVLSPVVLTLAALAIHELLPSRQKVPLAWAVSDLADLHPYPTLLRALLAASLLLAVVPWAWRPLRPWARHYAPLTAGFLFLFGLWDLCTLKMGWLKMPFFPGPDMVLTGMIEHRELLLESTW